MGTISGYTAYLLILHSKNHDYLYDTIVYHFNETIGVIYNIGVAIGAIFTIIIYFNIMVKQI